MGLKTAGVGHIQLPAAPAAGVSITSGTANLYTTTAVAIGTTPSAVYVTGIHVESAAALAATYISVQLMVGANAIGQYLVPLSTGSTVALGFRPIYPPIAVATATSITAKTADSVGSKATLVSLEIIAQTNVVDDGIAQTTNVTQWNGTNVAAPATAGIPEVNVKNINNVATTSVTTINANVGQTQPVNFTGTGASALVKSDMVDIAGAAVATGTAQIGVNVVNAAGTAWGSGGITAASIATSALNGKGDWATVNPTNLTAAQIATGIWQDTTAGDFTTALSVGKSVMNGVSLGTGLTVASVSGSVGSVTGLTASNLDATITSRLASASYTAPDNTRPANFTALSISAGGVVSASGNWSVAGDAMTLTGAYDFSKGTTAITESYRANGAAPTPAQALCEILGHLGEASISGTTKTVSKVDHMTTAATFTLDNAASPTSITRAT